MAFKTITMSTMWGMGGKAKPGTGDEAPASSLADKLSRNQQCERPWREGN